MVVVFLYSLQSILFTCKENMTSFCVHCNRRIAYDSVWNKHSISEAKIRNGRLYCVKSSDKVAHFAQLTHNIWARRHHFFSDAFRCVRDKWQPRGQTQKVKR